MKKLLKVALLWILSISGLYLAGYIFFELKQVWYITMTSFLIFCLTVICMGCAIHQTGKLIDF